MKCFDRIKFVFAKWYVTYFTRALEVQSKTGEVPSYDIIGIRNQREERLVLNKAITVTDRVETWLQSVVHSMKTSLNSMISRALTEFPRLPYNKFVFFYPTQVE